MATKKKRSGDGLDVPDLEAAQVVGKGFSLVPAERLLEPILHAVKLVGTYLPTGPKAGASTWDSRLAWRHARKAVQDALDVMREHWCGSQADPTTEPVFNASLTADQTLAMVRLWRATLALQGHLAKPPGPIPRSALEEFCAAVEGRRVETPEPQVESVPEPPLRERVLDVLTEQQRKVVEYLWDRKTGAGFDAIAGIPGAFRQGTVPNDDTIKDKVKTIRERLEKADLPMSQVLFEVSGRRLKLILPPGKPGG